MTKTSKVMCVNKCKSGGGTIFNKFHINVNIEHEY